jgi:hypothetical protein
MVGDLLTKIVGCLDGNGEVLGLGLFGMVGEPVADGVIVGRKVGAGDGSAHQSPEHTLHAASSVLQDGIPCGMQVPPLGTGGQTPPQPVDQHISCGATGAEHSKNTIRIPRHNRDMKAVPLKQFAVSCLLIVSFMNLYNEQL